MNYWEIQLHDFPPKELLDGATTAIIKKSPDHLFCDHADELPVSQQARKGPWFSLGVEDTHGRQTSSAS